MFKLDRRNRIFALMVVFIFVVLLAACQSGDNQSEESATANNPTENTGSTKNEPEKEQRPPVDELVIFSTSGWSEEQFDGRFGSALREKFPDYPFKYVTGKTYEELFVAGEQIDMIWESLASYANAREHQIQYDMNDLINELGVDLSRINPAFLTSMENLGGGKMIGLPVVSNTLGLYYNKEIFDRFGVPYPEDNMTWDEILKLHRELTREDDGTLYVGLSLGWPNHYFRMNQFSLPYVDKATEKTTINDDNWEDVFGLVKQVSEVPLYRETVQESGEFIETASFFKDRNVAMVTTMVNEHLKQDSAGLDWDMVTYPAFSEAPNVGPQPSPTIFGIANTSEYKPEVMEMIQYLISDEFQMEVSLSGTLPVVHTPEIIEAFGKETEFSDKNLKSAFHENFASISEKTKYDKPVEKVFLSHLVPLVLGEIDMNTMQRMVEEEANATIESTE